VLASAQTILDLGANRGAFSTMAAACTRIVIAVEAQNDYVEAIKANMAVNGFSNYILETAFVNAGDKGDGYEDRARNTVSIQELAEKHQVMKFDIIKIDIEGSEFALFQSTEWLRLVGGICMEVHPTFGSVQTILDSLEKGSFSVVATDHLFRPVKSTENIEFIYAVKRGECPVE
jgi:hypothetical protein